MEDESNDTWHRRPRAGYPENSRGHTGQFAHSFVAIVPFMSMVADRTKVDYGAVYHGAPDDPWAKAYKKQNGAELSFF